jgi:hypothetical protein
MRGENSMFNKDHFKINITVTITVTPDAPAAKPVARPATKRTPTNDSKVIASVGYDRLTRTLEIEFRSGKAYSYAQVSAYVYEELIEAASPGQYFSYYIRDKYTTREITR